MIPPKAINGITDPSKARLVYWSGTEYQHAPADGVGYQPLDADLTTIAGLTPSAGAVMIGDGSNWTADTTPTLTGLLTTNGQVAFPSTQNPSSNVNTLDDYEEGTFTPTIVGGTSAGVGTYTTQTGTYTKIGNRVCIDLSLNWSAHTGTGTMIVGGLPFTVGAGIGSMAVGWSTLTYTGTGVSVIPSAGSTQIQLRDTPATTAGRANLNMDTAAVLIIGGSYTV